MIKRINREKKYFANKKKPITVENGFENCSLIQYSIETFSEKNKPALHEIIFSHQNKVISWFNIYGFQHLEEVKKIVAQNKIDDFVINLTLEHNHRNKAIELSNCYFFTIKAIYDGENMSNIYFEQLIFIVSQNYIWSIQEVKGDHFEHIRTRLRENIGTVRKKNIDYLLYLIIEAILDNYYATYEVLLSNSEDLRNLKYIKPTPNFAKATQNNNQKLLQIKKAATSLKEAIVQLEKSEIQTFNQKYLTELKEQVNFLNDDIDFNLQQFENAINLIFNIQNHHLNEIMKTLTILSVTFIPLSFLTGLYGMNFKNMPELTTENGYFILLFVMGIIFGSTLYFFWQKRWFE
jgi:magnesium transporter